MLKNNHQNRTLQWLAFVAFLTLLVAGCRSYTLHVEPGPTTNAEALSLQQPSERDPMVVFQSNAQKGRDDGFHLGFGLNADSKTLVRGAIETCEAWSRPRLISELTRDAAVIKEKRKTVEHGRFKLLAFVNADFSVRKKKNTKIDLSEVGPAIRQQAKELGANLLVFRTWRVRYSQRKKVQYKQSEGTISFFAYSVDCQTSPDDLDSRAVRAPNWMR